jgi:D-alanyl-D-alanine dipeptidase
MWNKIKIASPELSDIEIEKKVRLYVAKPSPLANHNCGGAIDVTLAYNGTPIDMGTKHPSEEDDASAIQKFPMFSESITQKQVANRELLRNAMTAVGFIYYPEEWSHYCWGDRMWAAYTNQDVCFYGPIEIVQ